MTATQGRIVVFGSLNIDLRLAVPRLPAVGETVTGAELTRQAGGKGANQAVAAALLGAEVAMLGRVGSDDHGTFLLEALQRNGVNGSAITSDSRLPTGCAVVLVDAAGDNAIAVAPGANHGMDGSEILVLSQTLRPGNVLVMQLEVPRSLVLEAARVATGLGAEVVLNAAPADHPDQDLVASSDVIVCNEVEALRLTAVHVEDHATAGEAAARLVQAGARQAIVTLGALGSAAADETGVRHFEAFRVNAVDSTAAGDAFVGALATARLERMSLEDAVRFASAAGALATTKPGAQASLPSRLEVDSMLGVAARSVS